MDMMRCLRQANYESNTVGWYTSTLLGRIWNDKNIASQFNYQDTLKGKCVLLVYDPAKSQRGSLALSAYRLTDSFMELYRNERFTLEALQAAGVTSSDIYEEVPITLHNCLLGSALLSELECRPDMRCDSERLVFGSHPYLEKNMEALMAGVDELEVEAKKISFYNRSVAKNQNYIAVQLHRRRQENAHRRANGQAELPEDDILANARSAPEPSRLEGLIATSQVGAHCNLLNQFAGESFARLFLAGKFLGQQ
jgi:translation initiation factor 3 subunit H